MSATGPGVWVVTGNPTSTELAAVVAALTLAVTPAAEPLPEPPPQERWGSPSLLLRRAHPFSPQLPALPDPDEGGTSG